VRDGGRLGQGVLLGARPVAVEENTGAGWFERAEGREKVTGAALYAAEVQSVIPYGVVTRESLEVCAAPGIIGTRSAHRADP